MELINNPEVQTRISEKWPKVKMNVCGYNIKDMVKIGLVMNVIGLILVVLFLHLTASGIFDFNWNVFPDWAK